MAKVSLRKVSELHPGQDGRVAITDFDLEIQEREFVVLVGPHQSGISSIVRMIAGLDDVAKGDIFIGDRRVNDLPPKDREIALVSENHVLYPRLSVYANLALGLKLRKFTSAETKKRVDAAAAVLGLQELLDCKPESLSGEQRQRVAIARGTALQPKVFLFDEPLAHLGATTRGQMRGEIAKLHQRLQATMIYATHDPSEAMALGGRIVVLNQGAIEQDGTTRVLYHEPRNTFVAGFVGCPPMNLVRGALKQERDALLFSEVEDGTIEVRLPISAFPAGLDFVGKPILLGIRPEEIGPAEASGTEKHPGRFPAIIEFVEAMGGEVNLYLQTGAHALVCRTRQSVDHWEAGQRGQFQLNLNNLRLFDPGSTRRIGPQV